MTNTLPNLLTIARILCLPVLAALLYVPALAWVALALYVLCAITDFLDGYLARKMNVVSSFGTFLDPIADKIFVAVLLLVLVDVGHLSGLWIIPVLLIFLREFLVAGLREFLGPKNIQLPVTLLAKWKTTVQMVALALLVAAPLHPLLLSGGRWMLIIAAGMTVITGWSYCKEGFKHI